MKEKKQKKKKMFVKACCARCNEYITNWTVRTTREEEYSDTEPKNDDSPLKNCLHQTEDLDLYPSYLSSTYLGPEHVMNFPDLNAANLFLPRARELDMQKVRWHIPLLAPNSMKSNNEESILRARAISRLPGPKLSDESKCNIQSDDTRKKMNTFSSSNVNLSAVTRGSQKKDMPQADPNHIKSGLVCPKCQYLLASSPTNHHLSLNGRVVIYNSSLKLTSSFTPFDDLPEVDDSPQEVSQGDPSLSSHHDELIIIHSREQFEDILLRSAMSDSKHAPEELSCIDAYEQQQEKVSSKAPETCTSDGQCSLHAINDLKTPADLIIVMGGQFWNPYCISGVRRLSGFKRKQKQLLCAMSDDTDEFSTRVETVITAKMASTSSVATTGASAGKIPPSKWNMSTGAGISYIPSNVNLGQRNTLSMNIHNASTATTFVSKFSPVHSPCTFLLLDCLDGAGGFNPETIFREDTAGIVKSMPKFPFFLVWYRGCFVHVERIGQHFQCVRGAIVGLDLARYIDLVVPRITVACELAFAKSVLGLKATENIPKHSPSHASKSKTDFDHCGPGSKARSSSFSLSHQSKETVSTVNDPRLTENAQEEKECIELLSDVRKEIQADINSVWKTKEAVPHLIDRPILKIKL